MAEYLNKFIKVIQNCSVDNTYKLAWARAIVELSINRTNKKIELKEIALVMFRNYWNQTIFFDLVQGSNPNKPPEFIQEVKRLIGVYFEQEKSNIPMRFERIEHKINLKIPKLVSILKKDVSWRFLNLGKEKVNLYEYVRGEDFIVFDNLSCLAENSSALFDSISYRWTQVLEQFNTSPRIAKKVKAIEHEGVKRKSLQPFRQYLDVINSERECFICGVVIPENEVSIDHVIPWSFMYSDDLWNLVYAHRSCNSQKLNSIPTKEDIDRLTYRNNLLLAKLQNSDLSNKKHTHELELAIINNYVEKFWISAK